MITISGAMVASLALPASASTLTTTVKTAAPIAIATPVAAQAPMVSRSFGQIGFTGVDKPKPKPVPAPVVVAPVVVPRAISTVSRSTTRVAPVPTPTPVSTPTPKAPAPSSGGVLGTAASLAGIPYVYGGTTTAGFDCSGFTQYVFGKAGKSLPRTSQAQQQAATPVSNPQPGDLVFFGSPAYHLGIYAGNGKMWDSPHTGSSVGLRAVYSGATYGRV